MDTLLYGFNQRLTSDEISPLAQNKGDCALSLHFHPLYPKKESWISATSFYTNCPVFCFMNCWNSIAENGSTNRLKSEMMHAILVIFSAISDILFKNLVTVHMYTRKSV